MAQTMTSIVNRPSWVDLSSADAAAFLRTQAGLGLDDAMVVAFIGLMLLIVLAIFRGRRSRRREAEDI